MRDLYPEIQPYNTLQLAVDDVHTLYVEEVGNPDGVPALFLHGGPGAGCEPYHRRFFDPDRYRVVLFDQRGAGRSTPHADLSNNTTWDLVADIEKSARLSGSSVGWCLAAPGARRWHWRMRRPTRSASGH